MNQIEKEGNRTGPFRGFGPRPELLPLRDGVVDFSMLTPERAQFLETVTGGYALPPVQDCAQTAYQGITSDGKVIPGLFALQDAGLDANPIVSAADDLLAVLDSEQRQALLRPLESSAWQMWTNAFPAWAPHGLRLQDLTDGGREAVLAVIMATLSGQGYTLTRDVMRLNGELGRLLDQYHDTLTEWMYWFSIFGTPALDEPWGWQIYGHHLDIHAFIIGRQLVLTPTFMGAEFEADSLFGPERSVALELVNTLSAEQLAETRIYERFADLAHELQGPVDGRHIAGAGQDNRVIPYQGIKIDGFTRPQRGLFDRLLEAWIGRMPAGPASARSREIAGQAHMTYFSWYGPLSDDHAFYYRVHSPVVLIEYDNHPGVFLNNEEPQPFHVHTIIRTPNGNDYGKDLLRRHLNTHRHDPPHPRAGPADRRNHAHEHE